MKLKDIARHITVLNLILSAAALLFFLYPLSSRLTMAPKLDITQKTMAGNGFNQAGTGEFAPPQPVEYAVIAEKHLFHPERRIPPEKKAEVELPKPEFIVYGTLITDAMKLAYLEDKKSPRTTHGRGKRQTALRIGQSMSGYTLKEVYNDKIIMAKGEDMLEVKVINFSGKRQQAELPAAQQQPPSLQTPKASVNLR